MKIDASIPSQPRCIARSNELYYPVIRGIIRSGGFVYANDNGERIHVFEDLPGKSMRLISPSLELRDAVTAMASSKKEHRREGDFA